MAGRDDPDILAFAITENSKMNGPRNALRPRTLRTSIVANPDTGRLELSTYCTDELSADEIWVILDRSVPIHSPAGHPARIDFDAKHLQTIDLLLDANWDPERHVDLYHWPQNENDHDAMIQLLVRKYRPMLRPLPA